MYQDVQPWCLFFHSASRLSPTSSFFLCRYSFPSLFKLYYLPPKIIQFPSSSLRFLALILLTLCGAQKHVKSSLLACFPTISMSLAITTLPSFCIHPELPILSKTASCLLFHKTPPICILPLEGLCSP